MSIGTDLCRTKLWSDVILISSVSTGFQHKYQQITYRSYGCKTGLLTITSTQSVPVVVTSIESDDHVNLVP